MPELPEVEAFRLLADKACSRKIVSVYSPDSWYIKGGYRPHDLVRTLVGKKISESRRIGKTLLLDFDDGTLALHFGMTGRLQVDDIFGVEQLQFAPKRVNPEWQRFGFNFDDGGSLYVHDPRRLGGVELNPDESSFGPDALSISYEQLRRVLENSSVSVKTRLMDQHCVAGIGNLIADEVLWRAGIDPITSSRALKATQIRTLHATISDTILDLISRGGCHLGDLIPNRMEGGRCPRDGAILLHKSINGRTSWFCPKHQH
jgi:formamidopyrimidine-DNA glycosylase